MYDDDNDLKEEEEISAAGMHVVGEVDEAPDATDEDGVEPDGEDEDEEEDDEEDEDEDEDE